MKPVLVERLQPGVLELTFQPLINEVLTVSGSAPSIEASAGAATATLTAAEIQVRAPANLVQALENVAGINQVSEGQAAVPAVRGLARGRTLILIDGARVSSERRVGPSATYLDPDVVEGSKSRAARARSPMDPMRSAASFPCGPERRAAVAVCGALLRHARRGYSRAPCRDRDLRWILARRRPFCGSYARRRRLRRARRRGLQLGLRRSRLPRARHPSNSGRVSSPPAGRATSAATSSGRATTRRPCASTIRPRTRTA